MQKVETRYILPSLRPYPLRELLELSPEDFVYQSYWQCFGRLPEPTGFHAHVVSLGSDPSSRLHMLLEFASTDEGQLRMPAGLRRELEAATGSFEWIPDARTPRSLTVPKIFEGQNVFLLSSFDAVPNELYPRALYLALHGREPTYDEVIEVRRALTLGTSRKDLTVRVWNQPGRGEGVRLIGAVAHRYGLSERFESRVRVLLGRIRRLLRGGGGAKASVSAEAATPSFEPIARRQFESWLRHRETKPASFGIDDGWYFRLEEAFRGRPEDVQNRMRIYLPKLEERLGSLQGLQACDLGCGRGEWVDLLAQQGVRVVGVDTNAASLKACSDRGIATVLTDAISFLERCRMNTLDIITGFHIIEHLPFDVQNKFLQEIYRVLRPGGCAILETPNPENLVVGACNFYLDPSHIKPIPPLLLQFMATEAGFEHAEIMRVNAVDLAQRVSQAPAQYAERFEGAMDTGLFLIKTRLSK